MKHTQQGYVNIPHGFIETCAVLAAIGLLALVGLAGYVAWWIFMHVSITP